MCIVGTELLVHVLLVLTELLVHVSVSTELVVHVLLVLTEFLVHVSVSNETAGTCVISTVLYAETNCTMNLNV